MVLLFFNMNSAICFAITTKQINRIHNPKNDDND